MSKKEPNFRFGDKVRFKDESLGALPMYVNSIDGGYLNLINGDFDWRVPTGSVRLDIDVPESTEQDTPKKDSSGKPAFDVLFQLPVRSVAQTLTYGAEKYGEYNWRKALDLSPSERNAYWKRLLGAALRHIESQIGSDDNLARVDSETKTEHLACAVADILMALDLLE